MLKLSVIIPVYKVESFIHPCVESVYSQGLDDADFEVIFVNDGTPDNSFKKIEDILAKHLNFTIINQENQGLSIARNIGTLHASGKYLLYVDSDDLLIVNCLQSLLNIALDSNADMIIFDYIKMDNNEIELRFVNSVLQNLEKPKQEQLNCQKGWDFFLNDYDCQGYVWRVLFNRHFLESKHLLFFPGITFEDIPFLVDCLLEDGFIIKVPLISYIYRQNPDSTVYTPNKKKLMDLNVVMESLWAKKENNSYPKEIKRRLTDILFYVFNNFKWRIILNNGVYSERYDIIHDLRERIPDLKFDNNIQQLIVTFLFRLMPYRFFEIRRYMDNAIWKIKKTWRFLRHRDSVSNA